MPLGVPHCTNREVSLQGGKILIPKGTNVLSNIHYIVNNPEVFPEPAKFNPDRFLDANGKYVKNDHNIIFGIGE